MGRKGNSGRKNYGLSEQYKHICIFVTLSDWDRLNFLADGTNKSVSRYIVDTILNGSNQVKKYEPQGERVSKSLCMKIDEHLQIKEKAEKAGLSVSNYILSVVL